MSNRRFAAAACVAAIAALTIPAGFSAAGPGTAGGTKVSPKNVGAVKSPGLKVGGNAKSNVPAFKAAKSAKRGP
ncbi:MAG: hypothetical protein JNL50_11500 [Phycisphaerae bacterium]|nr:hypothetical protein [Phycisphaerae bacterium]